jgi:hypothetical protein
MSVKHHARNARRFFRTGPGQAGRTGPGQADAKRQQDKERMLSSFVTRTWLLFPRALAPSVRAMGLFMSDSTAAPFSDTSVGDFVLAEMIDKDSLDHFRDTVLQPMAEKLSVPLINLVLNVEMPSNDSFPKEANALFFAHKYVWLQIEESKLLDQLGDMSLGKIFG